MTFVKMGNCFYESLSQLLNENIPPHTPSTWSLWIFHIFRYKKCHTSLPQSLTAPLKASKRKYFSHTQWEGRTCRKLLIIKEKNVPSRKHMNSMKIKMTHPSTYFDPFFHYCFEDSLTRFPLKSFFFEYASFN